MASAVGQHLCDVRCGAIFTTEDTTEIERSRGKATAPSAPKESGE